jgi:DNA-binding transcriptional MerR regulator
MADDEVTLTELAEQTGESTRTLRFYVMQGLLRGPDASGPRARYPSEYVARVRWIRERQSEGLSLGRIAKDLQALDAAGLPLPTSSHASPVEAPRPPAGSSALDYLRHAGLLPKHGPPAAAPAPAPVPSPSAVDASADPARSTWEHVLIADGVELHVRRPLDPFTQRRVKQLLQQARDLFRKA